MNNKSELLQQLKIDRNESPATPGFSFLQVLLTVIVCVAITIWLTLTFTELKEPSSTMATNSVIPPLIADKSAENEHQSTATKPSKPVGNTTNTNKNAENKAILNSSGYITARRMATVSAEIMGLIKAVEVEEGMTVTKGQVLARLDNVLAQANLDFAEAQIEVVTARKDSILANYQEAERNHQRIINNDYSSDADRTGALSQLQSLTASLKSAEADILSAVIEVSRQQERLNDHTIRAPFAGVVTVKNAQPGEIVAPSSAGGGFTRTGICTIVDMTSLEIEVDVNESFIGRVYSGQEVQAKLDAYPDWQIPASVIAIIPTADRAKATVQVRIKLEIEDQRILPDMGVKVAFLNKKRED